MIRTCLLLCLIFLGGRLFAQDVASRSSIDNYVIEYLQTVGNQSALYYGKPQEAHPRTQNHPYLKDPQYTKARLSYRQIVYPEAMLRLDCNRDELIVLLPDYRNIVLVPENVDDVVLYDQHIIYFRHDSLPGCPSSGYYILLHSGKCKVLEKQTATFLLKGSFSSEYDYHREIHFFLYKDGVYYTIRTKKGLLKVLQPHKKELKRFISSHRLRFKENTEAFLTRTVSEYEKLSGSR